MKNFLKSALFLASYALILQGCEKEEQSYITLSEPLIWHNSCNFECQYSPWENASNEYKDITHKVGDRVMCYMDSVLCVVEFKSTAERMTSFHGSFHLISKGGKDVNHEDGDTWYYPSNTTKRLNSNSYDVEFSPIFYQKSSLYGSGYYIPKDIIQKIVKAVNCAYSEDKVAEGHGETRPDFGVRCIRPYMVLNNHHYFYYDETDGYYYQKSKGWKTYQERADLEKYFFDPNSEFLILD